MHVEHLECSRQPHITWAGELRILQQNSLAQHWARDWRALALTQVHQGSRLSDSCEGGEALSSVHPPTPGAKKRAPSEPRKPSVFFIALVPVRASPEKKERKPTTQGRDGRTARRHHTGILRRGV